MSDSNRNKQANRWQELADDLGLPEDPHAAPAARQEEPAPYAEPEPPKQVPYDETDDSFALTPALNEREEAEPRETRQEEHAETVFQPETIHVEAFEETVIIQSAESPDLIFAEETEAAPTEAEGPSQRTAGRRRRRRRSGGKNKKPANGEQPADAPEAPEQAASTDFTPESLTFSPPSEESGEPEREESREDRGSRGRNRGRGRRRREEEAEVAEETSADEDEVQESGGAVGLEEDDDDEEVPNYANWSVPSWRDLIASLYRPER
jgi:ribonuclease E